jgi:hypothetical protein
MARTTQPQSRPSVLHCPPLSAVVRIFAYTKWPYYALATSFLAVDALVLSRDLPPVCGALLDLIEPTQRSLDLASFLLLLAIVVVCVELTLYRIAQEAFPEEPRARRAKRMDATALIYVMCSVISGYTTSACQFAVVLSALVHTAFLLVFLDLCVPMILVYARLLPRRFIIRPAFRELPQACIASVLIVLHSLVHLSYEYAESRWTLRVVPPLAATPMAVALYIYTVYSAAAMRRSRQLVVMSTDGQGRPALQFGLRPGVKQFRAHASETAHNKRQ